MQICLFTDDVAVFINGQLTQIKLLFIKMSPLIKYLPIRSAPSIDNSCCYKPRNIQVLQKDRLRFDKIIPKKAEKGKKIKKRG